MDKAKGDGHGQSFCSSFFSTFEKDLEVLLPFSLPSPSSIFYASKKKKRGEGDNGPREMIIPVSLQ